MFSLLRSSSSRISTASSRRSLSSLVFLEHKRGEISPASLSAVTAATTVGGDVSSLPFLVYLPAYIHLSSHILLQVSGLVTGSAEDVKAIVGKAKRSARSIHPSLLRPLFLSAHLVSMISLPRPQHRRTQDSLLLLLTRLRAQSR